MNNTVNKGFLDLASYFTVSPLYIYQEQRTVLTPFYGHGSYFIGGLQPPSPTGITRFQQGDAPSKL